MLGTGNNYSMRNSELGIRNFRYSALRIPHSEFGLTLVEILVSVAILAAGTVLVLQALGRGAYLLTVARQRSNAYAFSAAKMADLELSLRQGGEPQTKGRFGQGRDQFVWQADVSPARESPNLALVMLTVSWRDRKSVV